MKNEFIEARPDDVAAPDAAALLGPLSIRLPALHRALLANAVSALKTIRVAPGDTVLRKGDPARALYVVADGTLRATVPQRDGTELTLSEFGSGEIAGEMAILAADDAYSATVSAVTSATLVEVPREAFEQVVERSPHIVDEIAAGVRRRLARDHLVTGLQRLIGSLDEELLRFVEARVEWKTLRAGEVLFRAGDTSDELYFVVGGRLRAITADGRALNEMSASESVGEVALLSGEPRSATVIAVRDTELVQVSRQAFDEIVAKYPRVMETIARIVVRRLRAKEHRAPALSAKCIAVVAAGRSMPTTAFCERLTRAFEAIAPALHLSSARFHSLLDRAGIADISDDTTDLRLTVWLGEQESRYRFLIYEAQPQMTGWTRRCLRQADEVILVADAAADPAPNETERELFDGRSAASHARCTLVLLHPDANRMPAATSRWHAGRNLQRQFHVRLDSEKDFRRIARCVAGAAVGVVLGGGGARGLAHIGVMRALRESGVAMDVVGGTSIGAVMAGLAGMELDWKQMVEINRDAWLMQKPHKEYGLPIISLIRSRRLDRVAKQIWGNLDIEDLWLEYFCISCNLSTGDMLVHERGLLWKAIRASASLPGVFVPVLERGFVLVDGGVVNNLPGDIMRDRSCRRVVLVDVGSEREFMYELREVPSPWTLLRNRLLPWGKPVEVFNIADVMLRTTDVASLQRTREVKKAADVCLRPPIDRYGLLQFELLDEIVEAGYRYGMERLEALHADPLFGDLFSP